MEPMVEAEGLSKRYGKVAALDGLTLSAPAGGVLAVLGPNGAGKTTFVRTMATLTRPDSGTLRVAGVDALRHPHRVRALIGLAGQSAAVEEAMTGRENLEMVARLFGQSAADARRNAAGHARTARTSPTPPTASCAAGRAGCAGVSTSGRAWSAGPASCCSTSRPPGSTRRAASRSGKPFASSSTTAPTSLLTTQYLEEADHLADRIVIIDHGRVIADGTPAELKSRAGRDVIEAHPAVRHEAPGDRRRPVRRRRRRGPRRPRHRHRVGPRRRRHRWAGRAPCAPSTAIGSQVDDLALRRPTLDEVFLALTGPASDRKAS